MADESLSLVQSGDSLKEHKIEPFELDVEHVLRQKSHGEMFVMRHIVGPQDVAAATHSAESWILFEYWTRIIETYGVRQSFGPDKC